MSTEPEQRVIRVFNKIIEEKPSQAIAVAAILTLLDVVKNSKSSTVMGLGQEIDKASKILYQNNPNSISLSSGCHLFTIFTSRLTSNTKNFDDYKKAITMKAGMFAKMSLSSRNKISIAAKDYIQDGTTVFTHGHSRAVCCILKKACKENKNFSVIICEGKPSKRSTKTINHLRKFNINVSVIFDSAIAIGIERSDFVLVGAEAVFENGGIVSQVGTYSLATVAKVLKKPFYVATESYKFSREFPLGQGDLKQEIHQFGIQNLPRSFDEANKLAEDIHRSYQLEEKNVDLNDGINNISFLIPKLDLTPPEFITLLFTDQGAMNTCAVSEELIKLYY